MSDCLKCRTEAYTAISKRSKMKLIPTVCYYFFTLWAVECAKVLVLAVIPAISHFKLAYPVAKALADKGHQVTVVSPYPRKGPIKNYVDVSLPELTNFFDGVRSNLFQRKGIILNVKRLYGAGLAFTEITYKHKNVQKLLNSNQTFDVVVMDQFATEGLLGIAHRFNAPSVLVSGFGTTNMINHFYANPAPSSYVQHIMMTSYKKHMNFWDRLQNFGLNIIIDLLRECYFLPEQRKLFKKYIDSDIELDDLVYNVSIILSNSHASILDAGPMVPNMINAAGFHVLPPEKLPQDLQNYLDNSKQGFVLFSMGSNLKSKDLKPEIREALLKAFSKIKQNVLWKFEEQIDNLPSNVRIMEWLPQQDVLAHPNIRAFITHGGMLSMVEAVTFGVPLISMPVFGDQQTNTEAAEAKGFAISLDLEELNEEKLSWALDEILNNPKYQKTMKEKSSLMNDRLLKPIDEAVYWIEYVARHRGAPHFKTAVLNPPWYQREMLDIFAFLSVVMVIILSFAFLTLRKLFNFFVQNTRIDASKKN